MFLNNILSYFIFYLPDKMTIIDKHVYFYNNKYYTDEILFKNDYILVTNDKRYMHNAIYIPKFRFFRGNDAFCFYDEYIFKTSTWYEKRNFEAKHLIFDEGEELSITLLFNLICRSLQLLTLKNVDKTLYPQIEEICFLLNLDFEIDNCNIQIKNMFSKLDRKKIIEFQTFDNMII